MSPLLQFRQAVYHAAAEFHGAVGIYIAARHPDRKGEGLNEAANRSRLAAGIYESALIDLLDCMLTSARIEVTEGDIRRERRSLELLEIETAGIQG